MPKTRADNPLFPASGPATRSFNGFHLKSKIPSNPGKNVEQVERDLKKLFPRESWNKLHLQIIFYGREHCSARGCDGKSCLLCKELFG